MLMTNLQRLNRYRRAHNLKPMKNYDPAKHDYFVERIVEPWEVSMVALLRRPVEEQELQSGRECPLTSFSE